MHCADVLRGGLLPDTACQHLSRPGSEQFCDMGPCIRDTWLTGQWGMVSTKYSISVHVLILILLQCSASCGSGQVHRRVTCLGQCSNVSRPHTQEECHAPVSCRSEWLTGRWTVCSHSCGQGLQTRSVECVVR